MPDIVNLYRKRAKNYNITANLYYLLGFRENTYRKKAVKALNLRGVGNYNVRCGSLCPESTPPYKAEI